MSSNDPVVIVGAARTPMGGFQGDFAGVTASELGAVAIKAAVERAGLAPTDVERTIFGCVLPAGQGQAPARQASIKAGLPLSAGATTVNKMCGSAMEAIILAHDALLAGSADVIVAGGMESMTNAPYLLPKARGGYRMGHQTVQDSMFLDGLEDAYDKGRLMGTVRRGLRRHLCVHARGAGRIRDDVALACAAANTTARSRGRSRRSPSAARRATSSSTTTKQPAKAQPAKIPGLKPAFRKDGHRHCGQFEFDLRWRGGRRADARSTAEARGLAPLAVIVAHASHAQEPGLFTTAPVGAIASCTQRPAGRRAMSTCSK
jgi:acetyl-CoA C-acetyltransferase